MDGALISKKIEEILNSLQLLSHQFQELASLFSSKPAKDYSDLITVEDDFAMKGRIAKGMATKEDKEEFSRIVLKHMRLLTIARGLQEEFNLLTSPHVSRVQNYLRTKNPKVFDGLRKRES